MKVVGNFMLVLALALAFAVGAATAQVEPIPSPNDPGLSDLPYSKAQPMHLPVARGGDLRVTLAGDEAVQSVSVGAPGAWKVVIGTPSDFTVHALTGAVDSTLAVLSDKHSYNFVLTSVAPTRAPYFIRMNYSNSASPGTVMASQTEAAHGRYRLAGNAALQPRAITDDGRKTFIEWRPDQAIPAVFALDRLKREEMVNGYMRDDIFTIDRVYDRLIFRIDRAEVTATRQRRGKVK